MTHNFQLVFDEITHTYTLGCEKLPSVTQITKPLSVAHYAGIPEEILAIAAERGTAVHEAIENWLKFDYDDCPDEYRGYFSAFRDWQELVQPKILYSELRTHHSVLHYAGTIDLVAEIKGEIFVVDYKTTSQLSDKLCRVQLEAYRQMLKNGDLYDIKNKKIGKFALHLKPDGSYSQHDYPACDVEALKIFTACKSIFDYTK